LQGTASPRRTPRRSYLHVVVSGRHHTENGSADGQTAFVHFPNVDRNARIAETGAANLASKYREPSSWLEYRLDRNCHWLDCTIHVHVRLAGRPHRPCQEAERPRHLVKGLAIR